MAKKNLRKSQPHSTSLTYIPILSILAEVSNSYHSLILACRHFFQMEKLQQIDRAKSKSLILYFFYFFFLLLLFLWSENSCRRCTSHWQIVVCLPLGHKECRLHTGPHSTDIHCYCIAILGSASHQTKEQQRKNIPFFKYCCYCLRLLNYPYRVNYISK